MPKKLLKQLKVVELKEQLVTRNLDVTGVKSDLVERLKQSLEENDKDPETFEFEITIEEATTQLVDAKAADVTDETTRRQMTDDDNDICSADVVDYVDDLGENDEEAVAGFKVDRDVESGPPTASENSEQTQAAQKSKPDDAQQQASSVEASLIVHVGETDDLDDDLLQSGSKETGAKNQQSKSNGQATYSVAKSDTKATEPTASSKEHNKNLWVSNIHSSTKAADLKQLFSKYGKVIGAKIVVNAKGSSEKRYGLIQMASVEEADKCLKNLHKTDLHDRCIYVDKAQSEPNTKRLAGGADRLKQSAASATTTGTDDKSKEKQRDSQRGKQKETQREKQKDSQREKQKESQRERAKESQKDREREKSEPQRRSDPPASRNGFQQSAKSKSSGAFNRTRSRSPVRRRRDSDVGRQQPQRRRSSGSRSRAGVPSLLNAGRGAASRQQQQQQRQAPATKFSPRAAQPPGKVRDDDLRHLLAARDAKKAVEDEKLRVEREKRHLEEMRRKEEQKAREFQRMQYMIAKEKEDLEREKVRMKREQERVIAEEKRRLEREKEEYRRMREQLEIEKRERERKEREAAARRERERREQERREQERREQERREQERRDLQRRELERREQERREQERRELERREQERRERERREQEERVHWEREDRLRRERERQERDRQTRKRASSRDREDRKRSAYDRRRSGSRHRSAERRDRSDYHRVRRPDSPSRQRDSPRYSQPGYPQHHRRDYDSAPTGVTGPTLSWPGGSGATASLTGVPSGVGPRGQAPAMAYGSVPPPPYPPHHHHPPPPVPGRPAPMFLGAGHHQADLSAGHPSSVGRGGVYDPPASSSRRF